MVQETIIKTLFHPNNVEITKTTRHDKHPYEHVGIEAIIKMNRGHPGGECPHQMWRAGAAGGAIEKVRVSPKMSFI